MSLRNRASLLCHTAIQAPGSRLVRCGVHPGECVKAFKQTTGVYDHGDMRMWATVTVCAIAISGCADIGSAGSEVGTEPAPLGNTARFCQVWPDARVKLLTVATGEETFVYQVEEIKTSRFLSDVDSLVPLENRDAWDQAYAIYVMNTDLGFVTGYSEGLVRAQHLEMAFGDGGRDAAVAETEAAIAVIDEWEVTACGDLCSRWPETSRHVGIGDLGAWHHLRQEIDEAEAALNIGDRLVPEALVTHWETITNLLRAYYELGKSIDFDNEKFPDGDAGEALFVEFVGLSQDDAREVLDEAREIISLWVEDNCDATAVQADSSGGSGFLSLWIEPREYLENRILVAALLPLGADFATNRSPATLVAGICTEGVRSYGEWEEFLEEATRGAEESGVDPVDFMKQEFADHFSRPLIPLQDAEEADYEKQSICGFLGYFGGGEPALIPGGGYELFVGAYVGDPGATSIYSAAPEYCLQFPVTVSGDTLIDLPELKPCTLSPVGRFEEIARRTPAPFEPGGTLQVEIGSGAGVEGYDYCNMIAVLLPTDTTLNDIGRGEVWPSGMFALGRQDPRRIEGEDNRRWLEIPGLVPVLEAPASGGWPMGLRVEFMDGGQWDTRFPDPIQLAAGTYDLRIEEHCEDEDMQDDNEMFRWCAFTKVSVNGATIVKMPELRACP